MSKDVLAGKPSQSRRVVKSMSFKKLKLLMEAMVRLYGEEGRSMSFDEVQKRHPGLIEKLDGDDIEAVLGFALSDEQVQKLDAVSTAGTIARDARDKVFGREEN